MKEIVVRRAMTVWCDKCWCFQVLEKRSPKKWRLSCKHRVKLRGKAFRIAAEGLWSPDELVKPWP